MYMTWGLDEVWGTCDSVVSRWCPSAHKGPAPPPISFAHYLPPALEFGHHEASTFQLLTVLSTEGREVLEHREATQTYFFE